MKAKPSYFDVWNRAHRGAFLKGFKAYQDGQNLTDNPYSDTRKESGGLTWSRSFYAAWNDGWRWAEKEKRTETQVSAFSRLV